MTVYVVGRIRVSDPSWIEGYIPNVQKLVESHGGKYLVRSPEFDVVERDGDAPTVVVVIEFPSKDAATAFYNSAEYQPWLAARKAGAATELILVDAL
jgi:uncharacterized protein (DUF1330 family)